MGINSVTIIEFLNMCMVYNSTFRRCYGPCFNTKGILFVCEDVERLICI